MEYKFSYLQGFFVVSSDDLVIKKYLQLLVDFQNSFSGIIRKEQLESFVLFAIDSVLNSHVNKV